MKWTKGGCPLASGIEDTGIEWEVGLEVGSRMVIAKVTRTSELYEQEIPERR